MPENSKVQALAAKLKEEGNVLYGKKQYLDAYHKYSEAIEHDDTNAVLFANRAACSLGMRKYLDAATDSKKATQLNSIYPKAWARLATAHAALAEDEMSMECWEKAVRTLPIEDLTAGELKQKQQYESELKVMRKKVADLKAAPANQHALSTKIEQAPVYRALAMEDELREKGMLEVTNSGWVLIGAYREFNQGVEAMKLLRNTPGPQGMMMHGKIGAIDDISNGILRDARVFHIKDQNWIELYNKQVQFEAIKNRSWVEGGPEMVIAEAQERQRKEGWDAVRPALSTTVRSWIMRGFLEGGLRKRSDVEVEFISRALEVLEWGNKAWRNVPTEDKGVIFKDTFIRGVHRLHMEAYMKAYSGNPGPDSKFPLENLYEEAQEVLRNLAADPFQVEGEIDPGFASSFYTYPRGDAHAMIGFYHAQMAHLVVKDGADAVQEHYRQAGNAYLEAVKFFPGDDENHVWYLNCALTNLYKCGTPIEVILPIFERIRFCIPRMKKIWENSSLAMGGRDKVLQTTLWGEEDILAGLKSGKFTLEDKIMPEKKR